MMSRDDIAITLRADLNAQDDEGLGWSTLREAHDPETVRSEAVLIAGDEHGKAVVRIVAVDDDGQVHFSILPGPVAKNQHLVDRDTA